jgi:hypothetical protein
MRACQAPLIGAVVHIYISRHATYSGGAVLSYLYPGWM